MRTGTMMYDNQQIGHISTSQRDDENVRLCVSDVNCDSVEMLVIATARFLELSYLFETHVRPHFSIPTRGDLGNNNFVTAHSRPLH